MNSPVLGALLIAALVAAGCDSGTTPTPVPTLAISCPAPVSVMASDGAAVAVEFAPPTATGGEAPLTTSCSATSGQNFPIGTTPVNCTARDARQETAACSFSVTVTKAPRLQLTKFMAFGDSITEGVTSTCNRTFAGMTFAETLLVLPKGTNDPWTYPNRLQAMLRASYPAQTTIAVTNQGVGGEVVADGAARLPATLTQQPTEVVLIQHGANDVNQFVPPDKITASLRTMVQTARGRGAQVLLGTLLPQRPVGVSGSCRGYGVDNVVPANNQIKLMAAGEGVPVVDLYQAFGGAAGGDFIGPDGLHPSEAGYQKIADTFFAAIKQRLEN